MFKQVAGTFKSHLSLEEVHCVFHVMSVIILKSNVLSSVSARGPCLKFVTVHLCKPGRGGVN